MKKYCAVWLLFMIIYLSIDYTVALNDDRGEKLISTFQIVRFPNDVCIGSGTRNGTCYTSAECSDKGGTSSGSCADGFGVCCIFLITTCGSSSSENITYWTDPTSVSSGACSLTICPISDDICSIRLDFTTFTITGPSTVTTAQISRIAGSPAGNFEDIALAGSGANLATNCLLDSFYATSTSPSSAPPAICGVNTGFHMYTEADTDRCNKLVFNLAANPSASVTTTNTRGVTTLATRDWDITATQIECSSLTLPPPGCTQYFYGSGGRYTLQTYNHQRTTADTTASLHLAMQHQRICIRRERGNCVGCFYAGAEDFAVSGPQDVANHFTGQGSCCAYGGNTIDRFSATAAESEELFALFADGVAASGFDCIVIPGAFTVGNDGGNAIDPDFSQTAGQLAQLLLNSPTTNSFPTPSGPQICGNQGSIGVGDLEFDNAAYEGGAEANNGHTGDSEDSTICSRIAPFVLEFISDDMEDGGSIDGEFNSATHAPNQGFTIQHNQLEC
jgi:hypothetical protein